MINKRRKIKKTFLVVPFLVLFLALTGFYYFSSGEVEEEEIGANLVVEETYPFPKENKEKDNPDLSVEAAFSAYISDDGSMNSLYGLNQNQTLPIASISKLMTGHIVLKNYNIEEQMGVSEYEVVSRTEFRDFKAWTETTIEEMLYPMIIESNNSAAFALALISNRFIDNKEADSVEAFVGEMNKEAERIDLKNTSFINPSGLDGRNGEYNLSTAKEVVNFVGYLLQENRKILDISANSFYRLYSPDKMISYPVQTTNIFLEDGNDWKKDIVGGKTGWTHAAFGCLVLVLEAPEGGYIINVVLGAEDRFSEMEKLTDYIYESYIF